MPSDLEHVTTCEIPQEEALEDELDEVAESIRLLKRDVESDESLAYRLENEEAREADANQKLAEYQPETKGGRGSRGYFHWKARTLSTKRTEEKTSKAIEPTQRLSPFVFLH